jgi:hypothetical protein
LLAVLNDTTDSDEELLRSCILMESSEDIDL